MLLQEATGKHAAALYKAAGAAAAAAWDAAAAAADPSCDTPSHSSTCVLRLTRGLLDARVLPKSPGRGQDRYLTLLEAEAGPATAGRKQQQRVVAAAMLAAAGTRLCGRDSTEAACEVC